MKKFLTLAAACLVTAVGAWAAVPDSPTNLTINLTLNSDGTATVTGSVTAPTKYSWPEDPLPSIDRMEITRSCSDLGESDEPVYTFQNPTPGETYTFSDECDLPLQMGHTYTYYARAYLGVSTGYSAYKSVYVGIKPKAPSVSVTTADHGKAPITMTLVAPTLTENSDPLTVPLTKLIIKEYVSYEEVVRHEIENPVAGQTYTWVNNDVTEGSTYKYRVYAQCTHGMSGYNTADILVGEDVPASPRNLVVTIGEDGKATLTWEAPVKGYSDGWFDPAATRYKIQRNSTSDDTVLEAEFNGTTYVDPLDDLTSLQQMAWRITALNGKGEGGAVYSESFLVGPAMSLPFVENVAKETEDWYGNIEYDFENMWAMEDDYYSNWEAYSYDWNTGITGVDAEGENEEGFIRFSGGYATEEGEWLRSPDINVEGAKYLVLSLHYTDVAKDIALETGYVKGSEVVPVQTISANGAPEEGADYTWRRAIVPFGNLADATKIKVHFRGYAPDNNDNGGNVGLDKIVLDDYCPVEAINVQNGDNAANLSWEPATNGRLTADKYLVAVNGAEPVETAATTHSMTTVKGENYTVSVTPVYGDIPSAPTTVSFTGGAQVGISGIQADEAEVEYFTADGLRALNPQKGMLLIRRAVTRDGKVRTSKIVF